MTTSPTATLHDATEAIHQLVDAAERLQSDVDGFTALLTDDVVIVNFGGRRVRGRDAVRAAMEQALASPLADVTTTQQVDHLRFLRPDVALVECTKFVHDGRRADAVDGGQPGFADRGQLTFVVVEQDGTWLISSAQTTPVVA